MEVLAPIRSFTMSHLLNSAATSFFTVGPVGGGTIWNRAFVAWLTEDGIQATDFAFAFSNSNDASVANFLAGRGLSSNTDNSIGNADGTKQSYTLISTLAREQSTVISLARPVFDGPEYCIIAVQNATNVQVVMTISIEVLGIVNLNRKKNEKIEDTAIVGG